jgi:hypothetical protein
MPEACQCRRPFDEVQDQALGEGLLKGLHEAVHVDGEKWMS